MKGKRILWAVGIFCLLTITCAAGYWLWPAMQHPDVVTADQSSVAQDVDDDGEPGAENSQGVMPVAGAGTAQDNSVGDTDDPAVKDEEGSVSTGGQDAPGTIPAGDEGQNAGDKSAVTNVQQPPKGVNDQEKSVQGVDASADQPGKTLGTNGGERAIVCSESTKRLLKKYGYAPLWGYESTDDGQWIEYEDEWGNYAIRSGNKVTVDMIPRILMLEFLGDFEDEANVLSWTDGDIQAAANMARSRYQPKEGELRGMVAYAHWLRDVKYANDVPVEPVAGQKPTTPEKKPMDGIGGEGEPNGSDGLDQGTGPQTQLDDDTLPFPGYTPPTQEEIEEQERQAQEEAERILKELEEKRDRKSVV